MLEPLESRIAPAVFVNAHIVTYNDSTGDHVTLYSSKAIFKNGTSGNVNDIFTFNTGSVDGTTTDQQLQELNLTGFSSGQIAGDNISITVQKVAGGSGLADVGLITSNFGLGKLTIQGDLASLQLGSTSPEGPHYVVLKSLNVNSIGAHGTATEPTGIQTLVSTLYGGVGSISVQKDITGAQIMVEPNTTSLVSDGNIGSLKIGGSLIGGTALESGFVQTNGNLGSLVIGGNLEGNSGVDSGALQIGGKIGSISLDNMIGYTMSGDMAGLGQGSGSISSGTGIADNGGIGSIHITGSIMGGDGTGSGEISQSVGTTGSYGSIKIGGTITGGIGQDSGEISTNAIGSISIGQGLIGSSGADSGSIKTVNGIGSFSILSGGIMGGTNTDSGAVMAATAPTTTAAIGSMVIHGNITGSNATGISTVAGAGQVNTGAAIDSFTLYGSLVGAATEESGSVLAVENIDHISLHSAGTSTGSILGGTGMNSGEITGFTMGTVNIAGQILGSGAGSGKIISTGSIHSITIGDGITGGTGAGSGIISTGSSGNFGNNIGSLTIKTGGITGEGGADSGQVFAAGSIGSVHLDGGVITGGTGAGSGSLIATDSIGSISLGALVFGSGDGAGAGLISSGGGLTSLAFTGISSSMTTMSGQVDISGSAGAISVHGNVFGTSDSTGLFEIGGGVKSFSISGALDGGAGIDTGAILAGLDNTSTIGSLSIAGGIVGAGGAGSGEVFAGGGIGHATLSDIIGGGGQFSGSLTSDGAIGSVTLTGTATANTMHGIIGEGGAGSGEISAGTTIGSVSVHGSVAGGAGPGSGVIISNSSFTTSGDVQGNIGSITISGSVTGGSGPNSGVISAAGNLKTLSITGGVTGTTSSGTGGILTGVDLTTTASSSITSLKIGGALAGADITGTGSTVQGSGFITTGHIGSAIIGSIQAGSVAAGNTVTDDGAIRAANDIASLVVKGAITGDVTNPVVITAEGQVTPGKTDLALGNVSVGGSVTYADFLAGYDQGGVLGTAINAAASIGHVVVGGNWEGGNLAAGVVLGASGDFGGSDASLLTTVKTVIPSIASIVIKGTVNNAPPAAADTYGFVAETIGSVSVGGVKQSYISGQLDPLDSSGDTLVHEIPFT
jgi:hypothetical protein